MGLSLHLDSGERIGVCLCVSNCAENIYALNTEYVIEREKEKWVDRENVLEGKYIGGKVLERETKWKSERRLERELGY